MEVTYQLTADDFRHGNTAWRESCPSGQRSYWINFWSSFVASMVLALCAGILLLSPHSRFERALWFLCGGSALWVLCLAIACARTGRSLRSQFQGMPSAQDGMALEISESGLRFRSSHGNSQLGWSTFTGWAEEEFVFVVFPQPRTFVAIPKRAFTKQQQTEFREMLRRNILPFKNK
jgi:hypothetical protein